MPAFIVPGLWVSTLAQSARHFPVLNKIDNLKTSGPLTLEEKSVEDVKIWKNSFSLTG